MSDARALADAALADPARGWTSLATLPPETLETALRDLAQEHGEAALPVVTALAEHGSGPPRRVAKRVLYRLAQRGIRPVSPPPRPVVERRPERAVRAWMSGIDGSGSRAAWLLFEGGYGALSLCSLLLSDTAGIIEAAGGEITKKRLEAELSELRAAQKLPWVELPPELVTARVVEAIALHARLGTSPPSEFSRWRELFDGGASGRERAGAGARAVADQDQPAGAEPAATSGDAEDSALAERSAELLELPEFMSWFLDPGSVQSDAVKLMEARSSRLIVSDQIKAEREAAIVTDTVEREFTPEVRNRWAGRLVEMALIFDRTDRLEHASLARATVGQLLDPRRWPSRIPFARGLAGRALEVASEVAAGRLRADDVSRQPRERGR
jgi:hypothetical protein